MRAWKGLGVTVSTTASKVIGVQLDCLIIRNYDLVGTLSELGPISNQRPFLDSATQTIRGKVLVFCKTSKQASLTSFHDFFVGVFHLVSMF